MICSINKLLVTSQGLRTQEAQMIEDEEPQHQVCDLVDKLPNSQVKFQGNSDWSAVRSIRLGLPYGRVLSNSMLHGELGTKQSMLEELFDPRLLQFN